MHNPDVFIMTLLMDEYQPHTCNGWGMAANENVPVIVRGGTSMGFGGSGGFESLFYNVGGIPKRVFIDHELRVHSIHSGYIIPGIHSFEWDGAQYSSGTYIINLTWDNNSIEKKVVLLK